MAALNKLINVNFGLLHRKVEFDYELDLERLPKALVAYQSDLAHFTPEELLYLRWRMLWKSLAREKQLPPKEFDEFLKLIWVIRSGRGFGKTLAGSNWLGIEASSFASMYCAVAPTKDDVRYTSCSADTLVLTAAGQRPIIDIRVGDRVMTRKGWKRVLWSGQTGIKQLMRLEVGGRIVRLTSDHRVWSESRNCFLPASSLSEGEMVLVLSTSSSTGIGSVVTHNRQGVRIGSTSVAFIGGENALCTEPFGFTTEGSPRWGITFTIEKTRITIESAISNALHHLNTISTMRTPPETGGNLRKVLSSSHECVNTPDSRAGTEQRPEENILGGMLRRCWQKLFAQQNILARFAKNASLRNVRVGSSIVQSVAVTRVNDVEGPPEPVYDLTIEDAPEFFANGVLVHNCFEGPTGLYAVIPPKLIVDKNLALPSITLWNGSIIRGFAGDTPERLRGPQHAAGWLDEIACLVAGTLVQTSKGAVPIELIRAGDLVWTRYGLRRVLGAGVSSYEADLWEMIASNGARLVGTGHHPVWVEDVEDFVPLCNLHHGVILNTWQSMLSFGMESVGIGGRITTKTDEEYSYTAPSTPNLEALSPRATRFITETRIDATIAFATWLQFLTPSTSVCTPEGLSFGVAERCHESERRNGNEDNLEKLSVRFARRGFSRPGNDQNSVHRNAATSRIDTRGPSTNVANVRALGCRGAVYNLEVEGEHEFYANGILTHNSWLYPEDAWDNLMFGLRLGVHPRLCVTGTPKPSAFIRDLMKRKDVTVVVGSTYENRENLTKAYFENVAKYEGTKIGRQEIHGEVLDPEEAGFVKRSQWRMWPAEKPLPKFNYIVYSLDTALSEESHDKRKQENDPTACTVWGLFNYGSPVQQKHVMLLDAWEDMLGFPALIKRVKREVQRKYGEPVDGASFLSKPLIQGPHTLSPRGKKIDTILIEEKGSGISLIQSLAVEEILAEPYNPGNMDKLGRLHVVSPLFAHKRVWAVESDKLPGQFRSWAEPVIVQVCTYTGAGSLKHDDLLDTTTQALRLFMDSFIGALTIPRNLEEEKRREMLERSRELKSRTRGNYSDA